VYSVEDGERTEVGTVSEPIGIATNNVAEYQAVVAGLELVSGLQPDEVIVRADSQLLVRQLNGEYRVKAPGLQPLYRSVRRLAAGLPRVRFEHVRREENERADALANEALDRL
jgi:ribonuclease HI